MNLPLEVILSLVLEILIGLWLIWQAIKINSNIDIFKIGVNWFRDRPIILPSLFFLMFPFLSTYIFHNLPADLNKIFDNRIIGQLLTTFGTVISIYIGNIALESFRKTQGGKKVAKVIVASMEGHLVYLSEIIRCLEEYLFEETNKKFLPGNQEQGLNYQELCLKNIDGRLEQIKNDYIYESALKEIGILKSEYINIIYDYSRFLNSILYEISKIQDIKKLGFMCNLQEQICEFDINTKLDMMIITKEILQDYEYFNNHKECVKYYYTQKVCIDIHKGTQITPKKDNMEEKILIRTHRLFKDFGLFNELDDAYDKNQIEFEAKRKMEDL